jgi:hypothetical protein
MISRSDYMENSSELHHQYYSQFVTSATISFVKSQIGLKKLQASNDPHLNDVVRWEQGGRTWVWDRSPMNTVLARELKENCSDSTHTCVGKAAARIILEEAKNVPTA